MSRARLPRSLALASLIALTPLGAALAADGATTPPSAPALPGQSIQLKELDGFVGHWHCQDQVAASPMGPAHPSDTDVTIERALDGLWLALDLRERTSAGDPHPFSGVALWGHDGSRKLFIERWVDSSGAYSEQTSSGWNGDTFMFAGDMLGQGSPMPVRDTFVRKGEDQIDHTGEVQIDGKWATMVTDTCKRVR